MHNVYFESWKKAFLLQSSCSIVLNRATIRFLNTWYVICLANFKSGQTNRQPSRGCDIGRSENRGLIIVCDISDRTISVNVTRRRSQPITPDYDSGAFSTVRMKCVNFSRHVVRMTFATDWHIVHALFISNQFMS